MADFSRYNTATNDPISNQELIELSPTFRDIRERISKYFLSPTGRITLSGIFPENEISLDKYLLNEVNVISGTHMQFIVQIKYEDRLYLFTSPEFLQKLIGSYSQNNPYLVLSTLSQIVKFDATPIVNKALSFSEDERNQGVQMRLNNFVKLTYNSETEEREVEVLYERLVRYINWAITKPSQNFDERLLPVENLLRYTKIEIDNEALQQERESEEEDDESNDDSDNGGSSTTGDDISEEGRDDYVFKESTE